jgi:NitT/TauT family transport system ATP-binding protein
VLTAETLRTDLIDLWIEGRLPIKSILMVTHNIEEAVLMCDRVLVFSSNPGRVAAEFKIDLAHLRIPTKSPRRTDMKSPVDSETMSPTFPI